MATAFKGSHSQWIMLLRRERPRYASSVLSWVTAGSKGVMLFQPWPVGRLIATQAGSALQQPLLARPQKLVPARQEAGMQRPGDSGFQPSFNDGQARGLAVAAFFNRQQAQGYSPGTLPQTTEGQVTCWHAHRTPAAFGRTSSTFNSVAHTA